MGPEIAQVASSSTTGNLAECNRFCVSLYTVLATNSMRQENAEQSAEVVIVKRSDLKRILALVSRLENQDAKRVVASNAL